MIDNRGSVGRVLAEIVMELITKPGVVVQSSRREGDEFKAIHHNMTSFRLA